MRIRLLKWNLDEKSYLIDKEMVIYSTLIDAATEHVEIFGKAGSTTIREIKIDNPQDSTIVLFIEKVRFIVKNFGDQGSMFTFWSEIHVYSLSRSEYFHNSRSRSKTCIWTDKFLVVAPSLVCIFSREIIYPFRLNMASQMPRMVNWFSTWNLRKN